MSLVVVVVVVGVWLMWLKPKTPTAPVQPDRRDKVEEGGNKEESTMKLTSAAFAEKRLIPEKYTCKGENINPSLMIKDVPAEAQSLALVMHDPDAPAGDWLHWTVWNIDPRTSEIPEGTLPSTAVEGLTHFGASGYGGPCPPNGTHHYVFELYALNKMLDLPAGASRSALLSAIEGNILATAELTGLFAAD